MKLKDFYFPLRSAIYKDPEILEYDMAVAVNAESILEVDCFDTDEDPIVIGVKN